MRLTTKQKQILTVIYKGQGESGNRVDVDLSNLIASLPYETTRDSMQFSIRALIKKGLISKNELELREERFHVTYKLSPLGIEVVKKFGLENK